MAKIKKYQPGGSIRGAVIRNVINKNSAPKVPVKKSTPKSKKDVDLSAPGSVLMEVFHNVACGITSVLLQSVTKLLVVLVKSLQLQC